MIVIHYLYFRIFRLIKFVSLRSTYHKGRVAFFFAITTEANIITIFTIIGIDLLKNWFIIMSFSLAWLFFWISYFSKLNRLKLIIKRFNGESLSHQVLGSLGTVIYILLSFAVFIKVMIEY